MSNEKDDFWDIQKLVPKKRTTASPFISKPQVKDFNIQGNTPKSTESRDISAFFERELREENSSSYEIEGSLIKKVTVTHTADKYDFYASFRKSALLYFDMKGSKCDFVPFFSYMPQYSQMKPEERSYYLFWREEFKNSRFIRTDYSYIYLFAYEILNLPDKIPPEKGLEWLITLFREYKSKFPNISAQLALWIQDYCLIYKFGCPSEKLGDLIFDAVNASSFKEFYFSDFSSLTASGTEALLAYLSYYDWRRGKYAGGESKQIYKKHLISAMRLLLIELWKTGKFLDSSNVVTKITRQSFKGSLCTHSVKAQLTVEYFPLSLNEELRTIVTEALRYTENQLRALLSVKSRLAVKELDGEYRRIIDFYFSELFKRMELKRRTAMRPEYEKLYDSETEILSFENADAIEQSSWTSTARLIEDTDGLEEVEEDITEIPSVSINSHFSQPDNSNELPIFERDITFLNSLLDNDSSAAVDIAMKSGEFTEGVAERINEYFISVIGDVVIDVCDGVPEIIEDYRKELSEWIEKQMK